MNDPRPYVTIGTLWPSSSRRAISTCPARIIVSPRPTSPTFANAAPASYERTLPNRRTRSISNGSRTGNIWSRRVNDRWRGRHDPGPSACGGQFHQVPHNAMFSLVVSHRNARTDGFRTDYDRGVL